MAQPLQDWLAAFVEFELKAVIQWKYRIKPEPGVEDDVEDRFGDDGSNFQSTTASSQVPAEGRLQIVKVLAVGDVPSVLVSDGFTSIKASFSDDALAALESELDEKLTLDMKGDVIRVSNITVISTPYGPADGFMQLHINTLEYQFSLRKVPKAAVPIHQRDSIIELLGEITEIRHRPQESEETPTKEEEQEQSQLAVSQPSPSIKLGASRLTIDSQLPQRSALFNSSSQAIPSSHRAPGRDTSFLPSDTIMTQAHPRKRRRGPSLETDGFETQTGTNLARPTAARRGTTPTSHQPGALQKPLTVSTSTSTLLGLLGGSRQSGPPQTIRTPEKPEVPRKLEPIVIEEDEPMVTEADESSINLTKVSVDPTPSQHEEEPPSSPPPAPRTTTRLPYARRKPPQNQRKLLDSPYSWFPSLPGRAFPFPNVPVQLLNEWNSRVAHTVSSGSESSASQQTQEPAQVDDEGFPSAICADTSDSSSDEELGLSQWPPTSPPEEELPLDSSAVAANVKASKRSDANVPKTLAAGASNDDSGGYPQRLSQNSASSLPGKSWRRGSEASSIHSPDRRLRNGTRRLSQNRTDAHSSPTVHPIGPQQLPVRAPAAQSMLPPALSNTNAGMAAQSPIKHPLPVKPPPPSSGIETVVKGTQYTVSGDEMEMDVPRALPDSAALPDPALIHRKRRADHFRKVQRQKWLLANYMVHHEAGPYVHEVLKTYREAHPQDPMTGAELAILLKEAFPGFELFPPKSLRPKVLSTDPITIPSAQSSRSGKERPNQADVPHSQSETVETDTVPRRSSNIEAKIDHGAHSAGDSLQPKPKAEWLRERSPGTSDLLRNRLKFTARSSLQEPVFSSFRKHHQSDHGKDRQAFHDQPKPSQGASTRDRPLQRSDPLGPVQSSTNSVQANHYNNAATPPTLFEDFALAWKQVRPGGAFASSRSKRQLCRPRKSGDLDVDVLSWDL